ncbi:MAG: hypothetical protein B5766_07985 [Candidatus Lumbricidophila eiseniae]|uniref:HTH araC/xylS-type domain-containing protein n=1 Tax=Candidatus Lumbricidiphila eiseniae TaxID=1969409 RepID=A0A2A6FR27_9MICO|nr:MAG: hypothetical protein B5766_07985 [Candidatus Lumbricidophila eiseniae]
MCSTLAPVVGGIPPTDTPELGDTDERTIVDLRSRPPFVSLGWLRHLTARDPIPEQHHTGFLWLAFPQRGSFEVVVDGADYEVQTKQVLVVPPRHVYRIGVESMPRGELLWLLIETSACLDRRGPLDGALARVIGELADLGVSVWQAPVASADLLRRAFMDVPVNTEFARLRQHFFCATALIELATFGLRRKPENESVHPGIRRSLRWLDDHLEETVTVTQLVEISDLSTTHFYQEFKRSCGTSPKDHILRVKISRAEAFLSEGEATITDIAHRLGFSSSQHFGTAFRRYVGISPSEYRRAHRGQSPQV